MQRSIAMADQLGQHDVVLVVDQAIYSKVKELVWARPGEFQRLVPRMGAFHITCNFLGIIGKRFGDSGLSDLLIECDVVAAGSMPGVLNGHHYNRATRAHKLAYEALWRQKWIEFGNWLPNKTAQHVHTMKSL